MGTCRNVSVVHVNNLYFGSITAYAVGFTNLSLDRFSRFRRKKMIEKIIKFVQKYLNFDFYWSWGFRMYGSTEIDGYWLSFGGHSKGINIIRGGSGVTAHYYDVERSAFEPIDNLENTVALAFDIASDQEVNLNDWGQTIVQKEQEELEFEVTEEGEVLNKGDMVFVETQHGVMCGLFQRKFEVYHPQLWIWGYQVLINGKLVTFSESGEQIQRINLWAYPPDRNSLKKSDNIPF